MENRQFIIVQSYSKIKRLARTFLQNITPGRFMYHVILEYANNNKENVN